MSAFTGDLTVTQTKDWRIWRLEQPLVYEVGELGSGRVIVAEAGFETDGASVPRWLWSLLPTWGTYSRAAVIHDRLLRWWGEGKPHPEGLSRADCDAVFWEAMGVCGVGPVTRLVLYAGVRFRSLTNPYPLDNAGVAAR